MYSLLRIVTSNGNLVLRCVAITTRTHVAFARASKLVDRPELPRITARLFAYIIAECNRNNARRQSECSARLVLALIIANTHSGDDYDPVRDNEARVQHARLEIRKQARLAAKALQMDIH